MEATGVASARKNCEPKPIRHLQMVTEINVYIKDFKNVGVVTLATFLLWFFE